MSIERAAPEEQGISSASIGRFIRALEDQESSVISMMLLRGGKVIAEFYKYPYRPDSLQLLFSLTKSITGIGIGIACDKGLLSLQDRVITFFPNHLPPVISENLSRMTVRDLLTMSCGIGENTYAQLFAAKEWTRAFLAQDFVHEPGTYYEYCTHASYMLSAIVEAVTGESFYTFIQRNLLEPLQIYESSWEKSPEGTTAGGMGLGLSTEAIAKFGQTLLCGGRYAGRQIVSEDFVRQATTSQIHKGTVIPGARSTRYGYQIHIDSEGGCFYGDGAFGQLCYVALRQDMVLAITSQKSDVNRIIGLLWRHVLIETADNPLPPSHEHRRLIEQLKSLRFPVPISNNDIPTFPIDGTYILGHNPAGLARMTLRTEQMKLNILLEYAEREDSLLSFRFDLPAKGRDAFIKDIEYHRQVYRSFASWTVNTLLLTVFYIETPYVASYRIYFNSGQIRLDFSINSSFTLTDFTCTGDKLPG